MTPMSLTCAPRTVARAARKALACVVLACAVTLSAGGDGPAWAQDVLRPPGMVPRPPANVPQNNPFNLFGGWTLFNPQKPPEQAPAPKKPPPEPDGVVYDSADAAAQGKKQAPEKFVLVIGDGLGTQLAQGLADLYVTGRANPAVVARTDDDLGVLPPEQAAGPELMTRIPEAVTASRPSATLLVVGSNDLRPLRDGDQMVEPLTDRWNELYGRRLDEVLAALRQRGAGSIVVVGTAPVQNTATSASYEKLNDLLRTHAARAGATFVPVWDGFVDEEGKYAVFGAAVDGQRRRLRTNDGMKFTKAGGRKLAFFTQKEVTRLLSDPAKTDGPGGQPLPDGTLPAQSLSDSPRRASILAGGSAAPAPSPVVPVSALAGESSRVLKDGSPLAPVMGRADDHSWPPRAPAAPAAP
ncbi:GDSL-type esterase/lipase family protein [Aquabacter cavernae]|uniref:SGNH/GDSL hydrolase family protein n=1 Tax=Aquabacter cavernae TaxID=2496029 RepID=UPI0013DF47DD|nr:GDSL-type esterase/lipase family protein [Aquabacter cavernae]